MTVSKREPYTYHPDFGEAAYVAETHGYDPTHGTHGTIFDPHMKGDVLLPASKTGMKAVHSQTDPTRAYYSAGGPGPSNKDEHAIPTKWDVKSAAPTASDMGWSWAGMAASQRHLDTMGTEPLPRAVVHNVVPQGRIEGDPAINPHGFSGRALTADSLKITDTEWIPPARHPEGVQGTLPHVNWNQFSNKKGMTSSEDANSVDLNNAGYQMRVDRKISNATARDEARRPTSQISGQGKMF